MISADLTTHYTQQEVGRIAANWVTSGDRTLVLDTACGSSELLTATIVAVGETVLSMGVDQCRLACAVREIQLREREITDCQVGAGTCFLYLIGYLSINSSLLANTQVRLSRLLCSQKLGSTAL